MDVIKLWCFQSLVPAKSGAKCFKTVRWSEVRNWIEQLLGQAWDSGTLVIYSMMLEMLAAGSLAAPNVASSAGAAAMLGGVTGLTFAPIGVCLAAFAGFVAASQQCLVTKLPKLLLMKPVKQQRSLPVSNGIFDAMQLFSCKLSSGLYLFGGESVLLLREIWHRQAWCRYILLEKVASGKCMKQGVVNKMLQCRGSRSDLQSTNMTRYYWQQALLSLQLCDFGAPGCGVLSPWNAAKDLCTKRLSEEAPWRSQMRSLTLCKSPAPCNTYTSATLFIETSS